MSAPTFYAGQLLSQPPKPRNQRIILHALPLLPSQPPPVRGEIPGAIPTSCVGGRLATAGTAGATAGPRGHELDEVGAAAEDGRDGRVRGPRILLDRGGDGYALGDDEGDGVDGDRDGAAAVLHARGEGEAAARGGRGQRGGCGEGGGWVARGHRELGV